MNREQLAHAIRAACTITVRDSVIVIGSQSILATWSEDELPERATASREADILAEGDTPEETRKNAELLAGVAGELSDFDDQHDFYLDGVDESTAILPKNWRTRLVRFSNQSTVNVTTGEQYTGWCLEPHDLCVAKLCAGRSKDLEFVAAVRDAGLVDSTLIRARLLDVPDEFRAQAERAAAVIRQWA
ncbi:MAG: hypothetical protein GX596_13065 [Propionibacterium sp.]|nr:hypothetical protein [Propionibacterium sp.]